MGSEAVESEAVGSEAVGSEAVRSEAVGSERYGTLCTPTSAVSPARLQSQVCMSQTPSLGRDRNTATEQHRDSYMMSDTDCCVPLTRNVEIRGVDILSWGDGLCLLVGEGPVLV